MLIDSCGCLLCPDICLAFLLCQQTKKFGKHCYNINANRAANATYADDEYFVVLTGLSCKIMKLLSIVFVSLLVHYCSALYFHIGEKEKKCFIEELPEDTLVTGKYRAQLWDKRSNQFLESTPGMGMHVEVKSPQGKVVLSKSYGSEGAFTFSSNSPGEHQICIHSNSTKWSLFAGGRLRIHLDIQVGEHANDYSEIASKEKLTELQLRVRQLLDQVQQIQKEQNYQRYREERFRQTSENTNARVLWWSIAQTAVLVIAGFWQMRHLKGFFEAKKLV